MNATSEQSASAPDEPAEHSVRDESPAEALHSFAARLAEVKEFAATYIAAKADAIKLSVRRALIYAALGIVAALAAAALLVTAVVLLLIGVADAIGSAFVPPKPWVGELIVSVFVLLATGASIVWIMRKLTGASRAKTVSKYESRHDEQRQRFGRNVEDFAAAPRQADARR